MFQILLETAPYRQWIRVTPRVPSPTRTSTVPYSKIRVLVLQSTIPTVLLNLLRYGTYSTAVSTTYLLPTTYYLLPTTYYLLPTTCYSTTYYLLPGYYLLPTAYCLLPTTCYLLPATY